MSAYLINRIEVTDARAYDEYRQRVPALFAAHGGRFLVRSGAVQRPEGEGSLQRASRGSLFAIEGV